ncbi:MAG: beta-ketoacyl-ACP synthase II [Bilifractor sp.]|nr:beta-ketoacyl-ACP synthase II [Lachnospiraceae bacterium]MDY2838552.1 beta-ketoacyl-ACP synthase II [Bilifractor sp.]
MSRRVVVTGLGIVCPIGNDKEEVWSSVVEGKCGIAPITHYDTSSQKVKLAGEVKNLDLDRYVDRRESRKMDKYTQFAMAAAEQAMQDSGLLQLDESRERWGVIMSSGIGGIGTIENEKVRGIEKGYDRVSPYFIPMSIVNMAAGHIAIRYGLHGMCTSVVTACASAANAIGDSFRHIRDGYGDIMVAGGAEAAITPLCIGGFTSLKALTTATDPERASIPFDAERSGFIMGEGAGALILEEYEHAKQRGAHIYAEIAGYGTNCDAYHITAPSPQGVGAEKCMRLAMDDAGITPEDVDYINAHGTSTKMNDSCESAAIRRIFSADPMRVCVSSTKSMTGHLLGASAAVEAVITAEAVEKDFVPPTVHYQVPDPECELNVVPGKGHPAKIRYALSNSFGFGGHNVTLVFRKV